MSEVQEVQEAEVLSEDSSQEEVDAQVLKNRITAYESQRDEHIQKAQTLHSEIDFCKRMLGLIDGNGSLDS